MVRSLFFVSLSSLMFGLASCSSATQVAEPPTADASVQDAPIEAGCPKGTHADGAKCSTEVGAFTRSASTLAVELDHHTTHVLLVGGVPYLYVVGGTTGWKDTYSTVYRAKIRDDGDVDAFEEAGALPAKLAGHTLTLVGDTLVLAGGTNGPSITGATYSTKLGANGKLENWSPGPPLPIGVMHGHAGAYGKHVYFVGGRGRSTGKSVANVSRVEVLADGTLGAMEPLADLPADRSHGQAFVRGDTMYVFGGLRGDPAGEHEPLDDVLRAKLGGPTVTWENAGKLPAARTITAAELVGDEVIVLGGIEGKTAFRADGWKGTFDEKGQLSFGVIAARLPFARGHVHQTPAYNGHLYSVGGKNAAERSFGTVDIAKLE